jgi:EAL domain-containing protein (putative c-di-GMP-specific phosphodiesterase class I)
VNFLRQIQTIDASNFVHLYQPICQIETGEILGYEALVRNKSLNELSPLDIFKQAEQEGKRAYLDSHLLFQAVNSVSYVCNHTLFLNVFPSTLLEKWFLSWWDEHFITPAPLVIEISESEPVNDWETLKSVINKLRKRGVKIAVDDMGSGYSFFQHWVELNPDYIKLDRYYAAGLAENSLKQRIIKHLTKLFDGYSIIILEGIETEKDLNTAKQLGISYAQGYLLGRPSPWKCLSVQNW